MDPKAPDPGVDTFKPTHRVGYGTPQERTEWLMGYLDRNPHATLSSGEGRLLLDRIRELEAMLKHRRPDVAP